VIVAVDGQDALNKVEALGKAPDLLFTDMVMPRMGGFELGTRLRERYPGLPVLYTTGYTDNSAIKELGENEVLLQKPFTIKALLAAIEKLLNA
jgi:CheY-like chemotaxis protein